MTATRSMTAERWVELKSLFNQAVALDRSQQIVLLEELRQRDEALGSSLRSLVEHYDSAPSLLEGPALSQQRIIEYLSANIRTFRIGELVAGRFRVDRFIGEGGMGEVYAARDLDLGEDVALKTLRPCFALNDKLLERFKLEIQTARRVTHPNVCRVFDLFWHRLDDSDSSTSVAFLTMQLIDGQTLEQRIRADGRMSEEQALPIVLQVLAGLTAAHNAGVVHRDLKSGNILITGDGRALITDFGLAHWVENESSQGTGVEGTPAYTAPEQMDGAAATTAVDIYGLGVVLYEIITGKLPFVVTDCLASARKQRKTPPSPRKLVTGIDKRWDSAVVACLQFEPAERPKTAKHVEGLILGTRFSRRASLGLIAAAAGGVVGSTFLARKKVPEINSDAARSFKRGQEFAKRSDTESLQNAAAEFKHVVAREPLYAPGWVGLAGVYATLSNSTLMKPFDALLIARDAAGRAMKLDSQSGKAFGIFAYTLSLDVHKWLTAEAYFQRAVALDPNDPIIRFWYGAYLGKLTRAQDAFTQLRAGLDQDPSSMRLNQQLCAQYFWVHKFDEALAQARETVRMQPFEVGAHLTLARALEWLKRYDEAIRCCDDADRIRNSPLSPCYRASIEASRGWVAKARKMAASVHQYWLTRPFESALLAALYAHMGDVKNCCEVLNEGYSRQDSTILTATCNPFFDPMRGESSFQELLKRLGWPLERAVGR